MSVVARRFRDRFAWLPTFIDQGMYGWVWLRSYRQVWFEGHYSDYWRNYAPAWTKEERLNQLAGDLNVALDDMEKAYRRVKDIRRKIDVARSA
jgi:hypothetical protein